MSVTAMNDFFNFLIENIINALTRRPRKEEVTITIESPLNIVRSGEFAELRGRHAFSPKFLPEGMRVKDQVEGERIYMSWRELASDKFFEDVEKMFEFMQKRAKEEKVS